MYLEKKNEENWLGSGGGGGGWGGVNGTAPPRLHLQMTPIHAIYALHMDPLCLYVGLRKTGEKIYIARQRGGKGRLFLQQECR
jgi:hypothetical protein